MHVFLPICIHILLILKAIQMNMDLFTKQYVSKNCEIALLESVKVIKDVTFPGLISLTKDFLQLNLCKRSFTYSWIIPQDKDALKLSCPERQFRDFPRLCIQCLLSMVNEFWCSDRLLLTNSTLLSADCVTSHFKLISQLFNEDLL
jgi:hypothetical protein